MPVAHDDAGAGAEAGAGAGEAMVRSGRARRMVVDEKCMLEVEVITMRGISSEVLKLSRS